MRIVIPATLRAIITLVAIGDLRLERVTNSENDQSVYLALNQAF